MTQTDAAHVMVGDTLYCLGFSYTVRRVVVDDQDDIFFEVSCVTPTGRDVTLTHHHVCFERRPGVGVGRSLAPSPLS